MDPEVDELLLTAIAGGGAGGGRPNRLNYRPLAPARWGVRLGAKMRPTRTHEETAELDLDPGAAAEVLSDVIAHLGHLVRGETEPGGTRATLRGLIGSGSLSRNPAVVDIVLEPRPGGGSRATVRTAAKEGLIPQHTAPKSAQNLLESYARATATPGQF
jgi:hypothetical protein